MSIRPEFADQILAGTKTVEFRKRPLAADVSHVIIYSTAPVSAVIGAFAVRGQDVAEPTDLWERFADVAGISRSRFADYFEGRTDGTGILVDEVLVTREPVQLLQLGVSRAPQSFQYLPDGVARRALSTMSRHHELARTA